MAIVLGNSIRADGSVWIADNESGEMSRPLASSLILDRSLCQPLRETYRRCVRWAVDGNADAMWWLGDIHEYGASRDGIARNKLRAFAFYVAAIRRDRMGYEENALRVFTDFTDERILIDADSDGSSESAERARALVRSFPEVRQFLEGLPFTWGEWQVALAYLGLPPHAPIEEGIYSDGGTGTVHRWYNRHGLDWWRGCSGERLHSCCRRPEAEGKRKCRRCFPDAPHAQK